MSATNHGTVLWMSSGAQAPMYPHTMKPFESSREREELEQLRKRYAELTAIASRLIDECRHLKAENEDLRASAHTWIAMYEHQVELARGLEQQPSSGPEMSEGPMPQVRSKPDRRQG